MNNPELLLQDILKLKGDLESQGMKLTPSLAGMYGEILAFQKIQEIITGTKLSIEFFSGQKGADIQLTDGREKINVEIKTSRLKEEGFGMWYGAALNIKKCRSGKHDNVYNHPKKGEVRGDFCYFDYVVFVALADDFSDAKYYVIPRSFIEENDVLFRNTDKRFSSATHRIIISDGKRMPDLPPEEKEVLGLIRKTEAFQDAWGQITARG